MALWIAVPAGLIPMLLYPLFLYWMDRYEKEPLGLLGAVFMWGFVPAAVLSLVSQLVLEMPLLLMDESGTSADLLGATVIAPLTEEIFKGLAVMTIFFVWRREFDGVFDGIIYGGLVGFGFAAIENILYFAAPETDAAVIVFRAAVYALNHPFYTSLTGIGFGIARHSPSRFVRFIAPVFGLLAAITAHSLHNATISFVQDYPALLCLNLLANWGGALFVFATMIFAIRRERQWIQVQLRDEVTSHTLTERQYKITSSPTRRFSALLGALLRSGPTRWWKVGQYFDALTELAYKKHARSRRGDDGATEALIEQLRMQAATLSQEMLELQ